MTIGGDFRDFCKAIRLNNEDMKISAGEIAKKLNKEYYGVDSEKDEHMFIVGSVGRYTAIKGSSDLDLLFQLPDEIYTKYNSYAYNGQSALLQDIKNLLKERYPNTDIRGDGQVVVIGFNNYTVELVPGFVQKDKTFKYPDTHDGGKWKVTDPLHEQLACFEANEKSNYIYFDFCHIIRAWKNQQGLKFGGLLIDTLVYNYFEDEGYLKEKNYDDYLDILLGLFDYLKSRDKEQKYWYAPGSNQHVYNSGKGAFVNAARKASTKITDAIDNFKDINVCLRELLGSSFPKSEKSSEERAILKLRKPSTSNEQFIDDLFSVDIRYSLNLECIVSQDGFRDTYLSSMIRERKLLKPNKKLDFYIADSDIPYDCEIYWKVRNVGSEAERRKCIRGEIKKTNSTHQIEHTNFRGAHYVECYAIRGGVCVARGHINVPIHT